MLQLVLNFLFGCSHQRTSFPLTPTRKSSGPQVPGAARFGTYVTCLECGKDLAYNWETMRVDGPVAPRQPAAEAQPSFR